MCTASSRSVTATVSTGSAGTRSGSHTKSLARPGLPRNASTISMESIPEEGDYHDHHHRRLQASPSSRSISQNSNSNINGEQRVPSTSRVASQSSNRRGLLPDPIDMPPRPTFGAKDSYNTFHHYESVRDCSCRAILREFAVLVGMGDLAGFQYTWILVTICFTLIKAKPFGLFKNIHEFNDISWLAIIAIPAISVVSTGIFDVICRINKKDRVKESLLKRRFLVPFTVKSLVAIAIFAWYFIVFQRRYSDDEKYAKTESYCHCMLVSICFPILISIITEELIITTTLVNSEQNLKNNTPTYHRFILFLLRPIVWVYNRAVTFFICFYAFYLYIYTICMVGWVCDYFCESGKCTQVQHLGYVTCFVFCFLVFC